MQIAQWIEQSNIDSFHSYPTDWSSLCVKYLTCESCILSVYSYICECVCACLCMLHIHKSAYMSVGDKKSSCWSRTRMIQVLPKEKEIFAWYKHSSLFSIWPRPQLCPQIFSKDSNSVSVSFLNFHNVRFRLRSPKPHLLLGKRQFVCSIQQFSRGLALFPVQLKYSGKLG